MGWRDFQATAPMEFMEKMELITPESSLIPLIPLIPVVAIQEKTVFDPAHWQEEIKRLADEISSKDPGGDCWQWMKDNRPGLWKAHLSADMVIDKAYQEQDAEKIDAAIKRARETFSAMLLFNGGNKGESNYG